MAKVLSKERGAIEKASETMVGEKQRRRQTTPSTRILNNARGVATAHVLAVVWPLWVFVELS